MSLIFALATSAASPVATGGGFEPPLMRLVLGFVLCAMIALVAALALKRFMQGGVKLPSALQGGWLRAPAPEIHVRETRRISANADVCAIAWREREFLVVVCAGGAVTVLESSDRSAPRESQT